MNQKIYNGLVIGSLFLFGFVLYSNTFGHAFHFDDFIFIVHNPEISNILDIKAIWQEGSAPTRFIAFLTFALNYHLHQYHVWGYHLVNILIHLINTILSYWLTCLILNTQDSEERLGAGRKNIVPLLVAALFLTHPIQTQAVTYLCQRFASLATLFYLLTVCFYLKARLASKNAILYYTLAGVTALLGMFTKQIVLTLPLMIIAVELIMIAPPKGGIKRILASWKLYAILGAFLLIIPAVYSFNYETILAREFDSLSHRGDVLNSHRYFLTQSRVIWTYIKLLFMPIGQNLLYDFSASYSFWEPKTVLGFIGIAALVVVGIRLRLKRPLISFGICWFFIALLVESSIIPIRQVIFEHRCYLPFYGFALAISAYFVGAMHSTKRIYTVCVFIIMTCSILTYQRNAVWKDDITLWTDVKEKSPHLLRPYTHLATAYLNRKNYNLALQNFTQAISEDTSNAQSYNNRGNVYVVLKKYDRALADYQKALSLDPTLEKAYNNIGIIYNRKKNFPKALEYYEKALALNEKNAGTYFNRANIYLQQNKLDDAFKDYTRTIELNPFQAKALYYRSQIYAVNNQYKLALDDIVEAQSLGLKVKQQYIQDLKKRINHEQ